MKKLILSLFLGIILLFACKPIHDIQYIKETHDSIVNVIVKDTFTKYLPQNQSVITNQKSYLSTDLAFSNAFIDSCGLLHHSIENKGVIPAKIINKEVKVKDNKQQILTIVKTVTVYKSKTVTNFLGTMDYILLGLLGLFGIYKVLKFFKVIA